MVVPLPGHIPALAGLLVLKFTLARRLDWRMKADLALGRLFLPPLKESERWQCADLSSKDQEMIDFIQPYFARACV